jgi:phospholipid transport system substrate-binding protein
MRPFTPALLAFALAVPAMAHAQASDPAAQVVDRFDQTVLEAMKGGKSLGLKGRYAKLEPAVKQTFNLPLMTRFAVGASWATMSAADQQALLAAYTHYSVSTWAKNFDSYSGQKFTIGTVDTRGTTKLVHVKLEGASVELVYRMQASASGGWKVLDVYFNGVSQLTQQRADYASALSAGGPQALVKKINDLADRPK